MSAHSRPRECGLTTLRLRTRSNKPDRNKKQDTGIAYTKTIIFFKNSAIVHKIITNFAAHYSTALKRLSYFMMTNHSVK